MASYHVSTQARRNGEHEVHKAGCTKMPAVTHRIYLGEYSDCRIAVEAAKLYFQRSNGCYWCCWECRTR